MTDSLRDQLLKLGFKKPAPVQRDTPKPKPKPAGRGKPAGPAHTNHAGQPKNPRLPGSGLHKPHSPISGTRSQEEIDLAKAYALRDRQERADRERVKREAEAKAQARRELKQKLRTLLQGKTLNDPDADVMRHFPHAGKIKRIYVNAAQLIELNAGILGVVQMEGRYFLVTRETAMAVSEIAAEAMILLPEPGAEPDDDWAQHAASEL